MTRDEIIAEIRRRIGGYDLDWDRADDDTLAAMLADLREAATDPDARFTDPILAGAA